MVSIEGKWIHGVNDRIVFTFSGGNFHFKCEGLYFAHKTNVEGTFSLTDTEIEFSAEGETWRSTYTLINIENSPRQIRFKTDMAQYPMALVTVQGPLIEV